MLPKRRTVTARARELRQTENPAEQSLWSALKNSQLGGHKFTRQFPIGPYFADFACRQKNLVIEVDGSQRLERQAQDRNRDAYMIGAGYSVFRVPAGSVLQDRSAVCDTLLAALEGRMEDFVDAPDLRFVRSFAEIRRRGLASRSAIRQDGS